MKIKKAKKQDAKEISKMIKQTLSKINVKHYPPEIIDYLKNKNSPERIEKKIIEGIGYVAIEDEKIMGSVFLTSDLVTGLYVKYKLINQGLGKELLKTIEKKAKKLGIKKLFLNPTRSAIGFYEGLGYKRKKQFLRETKKFKTRVWIMEKKL